MKIAVTGAIGSGKSTVVRAAMKQLGWDAPAGFFTHWSGAGRGAPELLLSTWTGETHVVARRVAESAGSGNLPFEMDRALFVRVALAGLAAAPGQPVVVDELGLLESGEQELVAALVEVFRGPGPVLAVIQQRALERWLPLLGPGNVEHLLKVEIHTRDALPCQIAKRFASS